MEQLEFDFMKVKKDNDSFLTLGNFSCASLPEETIFIPKYVGVYEITPNFSIASSKRPSFINRFFVKKLLGWNWKDS